MKRTSKLLSMIALLLFICSMFVTPPPVANLDEVTETTSDNKMVLLPDGFNQPAIYPDNYTHVTWNQSTVSETWEESFGHSYWEFGPTITYSIRNSTTQDLVTIQDHISLNGWADYTVKIPKSAIQGTTLASVAFMGSYMNVSEMENDGRPGSSTIGFLAIYEFDTDAWWCYSTKNSTMNNQEPTEIPDGSELNETLLEMVFGPVLDPYLVIDSFASGMVMGAENVWVKFRLMFNSSTTIGAYGFQAVALDSSIEPFAMSEEDELGLRAVGITFDEVFQEATGGFYSWDRYDDDGNPVLSATRGVDFSMTANITGPNLDNVTVLIDLPQTAKTMELVDGPYSVTETVYGGWEYDNVTYTYFWNTALAINYTRTIHGLHMEEQDSWFENGVEFWFDEPVWNETSMEWDFIPTMNWAWTQQAVIYWFGNNTFDIRLAYTAHLPVEFREDPYSPEGGWWDYREVTTYYPWPSDGSVPQPYVLNETASSYTYIGGNDIVTFRGHMSEEITPTGIHNPALDIREKVFNVDGKILANSADLPWVSAESRIAYTQLQTLAIESPISNVQLIKAGQVDYDTSWMFLTDRGETFTVMSTLQGDAVYTDDIDGVAFVMNAHQEDWGYDNVTMSDWSQWSDINIWVKINTMGDVEITIYNYTQRYAWEFSGAWIWEEIYPGMWDQVWREEWHWSQKIWDFVADDWTTEWVQYQSNQTKMQIDYVIIDDVHYTVLGNDLEVKFNVTSTLDIPQLEWNWDYYYANLTLTTDYEAGWGEHQVIDWTRETVYSYLNGSIRVYVEPPKRSPTFRNNDTTDVLYPAASLPYIIIDGKMEYVRSIIESDMSSSWETIIFEEWNSTAYNPETETYSGYWEYSYQFANGTSVPIATSVSVEIFNITLISGTWFESANYEPQHAWWLPGDMWYVYAINGSFIFGDNATFWTGHTSDHIGSAPGKEVGNYILTNHTIPLIVLSEPMWTGDHYIYILDGTFEELHFYWDYDPSPFDGGWYYRFFNFTSGETLWLKDGEYPYRVYEIDWDSQLYLIPEQLTQFYAYTTIGNVEFELPYPGADINGIWDLNWATPRTDKVLIDETWHDVVYNGTFWHATEFYDYDFYTANVTGTIYNLTHFGVNPAHPWQYFGDDDMPWTTLANGTHYIPELKPKGWTVTYGYRNPVTWQFIVEGTMDLDSGFYNGDYGSSQIYNNDLGYDYVVNSTGHYLNYTQIQRLFMYNVTFPNGTYFYSGHPWVEEVVMYNTAGDYYEVQFYYMYDVNMTMMKWYDWTEVTIDLVIPDDFNGMSQQFLLNGSLYNITQFDYYYYNTDLAMWENRTEWNVEIDWFWALRDSLGKIYEVVPLYDDWDAIYNNPRFIFNVDATQYNVTGDWEMIYKSHSMWGYSQKYDYAPLPITVIRQQWSIVIGVPEWGMWDLSTWTTDPITGAIDLDGNLETLDDQYYVKKSFESSDIFNVTETYLEVSIMWEPNGTIMGDEFYIDSFMGMRTVNWTSNWYDNFYWYHADTIELVSSAEMAIINSTILDSYGFPRPGYWDIAWMAENFTSADLKQQAIDEGWEWAAEDSQVWSWIWWDMYEHYGTEYDNGTETAYMSVDAWYEYAGIFAWNDTNTNDVLDYTDYTDAEVTHYWMPVGVDAISFITPNASSSGDEIWPVDADVPFGVTFSDIAGIVVPFGEYSYFDWYQGQYTGSDFLSFDDRPSMANTTEFSIGATFSGTVNSTGNNIAEVKFNITVGDWDIDAPGGRAVLEDYSLGVAFYSDVSMYNESGDPIISQYYDEYGNPVANNGTTPSSNYTIGFGPADVASMNLGGELYSWSKAPSANYTLVDSQTIPAGAFSAAYSSEAGGTATSFTVSDNQFYTLINFKWWDGFAVSVDPVFVGYTSTGGVDDTIAPTVHDSITETVFVDSNERLYFEVEASDAGGSGIESVLVMNTNTSTNVSLSYNGDENKWMGYVQYTGVTPYAFNYRVIVVDYAGNEYAHDQEQYTYWNDPEIPSVTGIGTTGAVDDSYVTITATVTDTGSGLDIVQLYVVNTETLHNMTDMGSDLYSVDISRSSGWVYNLAYRIIAYDAAGNVKTSSELTYLFNDAVNPAVSGVTDTVLGTLGSETLLVEAFATDSGGSDISTVDLTYTILGSDTVVSMIAGSETDQWEYTIPNQAPGTYVYYTITATDGAGNTFTSSEEVYQFYSEADTAPGIGSFSVNPTVPTSSDSVTISVTILDDIGVKNATLFYRVDGGAESSVAMSAVGDVWSAVIPAQANDAVVTFYVIAYDTIDQMTISGEDTYAVGSDAVDPVIASVLIDISQPTSSDSVTISATVTDDVALDNVTLHYHVDGGSWSAIPMTASGDIYSGTIPAQADGSVVTYYIRAYDTAGNIDDSAQQSYSVQDTTWTPPPTTTTDTTTTDTTTSTIPPGAGLSDSMIMIIGIGGVLVVVVLLVVMKKRK